jgi:hypothetical protein
VTPRRHWRMTCAILGMSRKPVEAAAGLTPSCASYFIPWPFMSIGLPPPASWVMEPFSDFR